uniref:hypothetical protein n=3 Tax=Bacteria TaxID=2 RepID=UPI004048B301
MAFKKSVKKYIKKAVNKGAKRYGVGKGKGGLNITNIARDLAMVKSRLNVEKKTIQTQNFSFALGQCSQNAEGAAYIDITPIIPQGITEQTRIGNSLKLTGMSIPISIIGDGQTLSARKIRISLYRVKAADNGVSSQEAFEKIWDVNPLTGLRDFNAPKGYRNASTDGMSKIREMVCYLPAPSLDNGSQGTTDTERSHKTFKFNVKLQDLLRYSANADTLPNGIKYYVFFQMDVGNRSGTASTLTNAFVKTASSGAYINGYINHWYVDN